MATSWRIPDVERSEDLISGRRERSLSAHKRVSNRDATILARVSPLAVACPARTCVRVLLRFHFGVRARYFGNFDDQVCTRVGSERLPDTCVFSLFYVRCKCIACAPALCLHFLLLLASIPERALTSRQVSTAGRV